ncbi:hypothetical protein PACTADRAFT_35045 [Pachysolen tannophilus NRRL Y-2460]|uniref:Rho-GAP domain-containing protein n=1 Tax=Pachysolen tannophilus NRRL Y-2460 TaxID=669874 RepID=A0A1E4TRD8_PACTA|nr:hypothetical protein PACTADRAFT_35045 [Pachysolen tannophilus NRRL Y-2460]
MVDDIAIHLSNRCWSLNYELGIKNSISLLDHNYSSLIFFQNNFLKMLEKNCVTRSYDNGHDLIIKNSEKNLFEEDLNSLFNSILGKLQDHFDSKLVLTKILQIKLIVPLNQFIESYKNFIDDCKQKLLGNLDAYNLKSKELKKLEQQYISNLNKLHEFKIGSVPNSQSINLQRSRTPSGSSVFNSVNFITSKFSTTSLDNFKSTEGYPIEFPLILGDGTLTFNDHYQLCGFLNHMYSTLPKTISKFPFVTTSVETFNVVDFKNWLLKNIIPSRKINFGSVNGCINKENQALSRFQIEKIGQSLLDYKFLQIGNLTKKFGKFKSDDESLWFEYTDLYKFIMNFDPQGVKIEKLEEDLQAAPKFLSSLSTYIPTSNRNNIQSLEENEKLLSERAKDLYIEWSELRSNLETNIFQINKEIEEKEYSRVEFIYNVFNKLTKILQQDHLTNLKILQDMNQLVDNQDNLENHLKELTQVVIKNNTNGGIYSVNPLYNSIYSRIKILGATEREITNFDEDFPPLFGSDLSTYRKKSEFAKVEVHEKSLPFFLYDTLSRIKDKELWLNCLNFESLEFMKKKYMTKIELDEKELIQILKIWLLELPDSIIPSISYESLKQLYKEQDELRRRKLIITRISNDLSRVSLSSLYAIINDISTLGKEREMLLNLEGKIGYIPFMHLILRPHIAYIKNENDQLIKGDINFANQLMTDLIASKDDLLKIITEKELNYERQQQIRYEKKKLKLKNPKSRTIDNSDFQIVGVVDLGGTATTPTTTTTTTTADTANANAAAAAATDTGAGRSRKLYAQSEDSRTRESTPSTLIGEEIKK